MPKHPFAFHRPDRDQVLRMERVRDHLSEVHDTLLAQCPPSRERNLALTNLEEAAMWANKSIVMEGEE